MNNSTVIQRNNVRVLGRADGPALLLVQGFGCDQVIWNRILPFFTDLYKVVLFDHAGTGGADPEAYDPAKYASLGGYLTDLEEVLEVLDLRDAAVVGHSVAGMMALAAAVNNPRIARLVLVCTSACYLSDDGYTGGLPMEALDGVLAAVESNYPLWAAGAAAGIAGAPAGSDLSTELADQMCRLNPDFVKDFLRMSFTADVRHLLPKVAAPTLILQTQADPLTPGPASRYLHEHLPDSAVHKLAVHGHMPHINSPRTTAEAILQHLEAVPRG
ncbi:alpha/beta hydrolase [Arthrobacter jiangjiafuii]|uniref:Alpha/beta hydrolase n=1 Tax=Arthrobacter jiangjiafuii TaxID=2817475 RepID=A0A975R2F7_9MICC|nr:alpha/beta hydrolase [Arthrobacter jiangjiafuii]MBP3042967.1 alpha/beta hydrolase [Arthrobacter jiangjiafuii]QWC11494.1 alpha/beta hydrolase [Arthrobacter jiangjiafuii]